MRRKKQRSPVSQEEGATILSSISQSGQTGACAPSTCSIHQEAVMEAGQLRPTAEEDVQMDVPDSPHFNALHLAEDSAPSWRSESPIVPPPDLSSVILHDVEFADTINIPSDPTRFPALMPPEPSTLAEISPSLVPISPPSPLPHLSSLHSDSTDAQIAPIPDISQSPDVGDAPAPSLSPSPSQISPEFPSGPENDPVHRPAADIMHGATTTPLWAVVMLMCAWLHHKFNVSWRGIAMILQILRLLFISAGLISASDDCPRTLATTFKRIGLQDRFEIRAMCPTCSRVFPGDMSLITTCTHCEIPLFHTSSPSAFSLIATSSKTKHVPILQTPFIRPSKIIADFINSTSTMEDDLDRWRQRPSTPGILESIQDGKVWQTLLGSDGCPFFDTSPDRPNPEELRIGIIIGFDGFGFKRSAYAGKHSTGVLSISIANLETSLRYRVENLLLCGVTPGPHELTADQLQFFMDAFAEDLLQLYNEGHRVKTLRHPNGRTFRVVVICECCDHPALCRMSGFGDHNTELCFCTQCVIAHCKLFTERGLTIDAFPPRSGDEHRQLAVQYRALATQAERDEFFKSHAARYYALSRLPYFDPVRMSVIDPMHNILLGVIKAQWYDTWILTNTLRARTSTNKVPRELDQIHALLSNFEMPQWVGRLPRDVGYPAGGSLTSDEWKAMALVYLPLIIPLVWEDWCDVSERDYQKKLRAWEAKHADHPNPENPKPERRMHPQDADNFLSLAAALKTILARSIELADLPRAHQLLQDYLHAFYKLHASHIKPNHHFMTHIFHQIEDFGPVYGFWTFLFERLNKVLKNYSVNNHDGGELEVNELAQSSSVDGAALQDAALHESARIMVRAGTDTRGTVASLAQETGAVADEMGVHWALGPAARVMMDPTLQTQLLQYYDERYPQSQIVSTFAQQRQPGETFLNTQVSIHDYLILRGRRITVSKFNGKSPDSLVQANFGGRRYVGEVEGILSHRQLMSETRLPEAYLLQVRWFSKLQDIDTSIWDPYPELEVLFWEYNKYLDPQQEGPPSIIPACRCTLRKYPRHESDEEEDLANESADKTAKRIWATVGLTQVY
ncbi:hypothetical protein CERSUDRAFT_77644 [Gelatoporia subvermispora B]|uniref:Uncharacterized protein n=1 Tax=Ceriporiopsis subvermispora (strain B) TaxID=914234 RepID=M2Q5G4_CERS8|nr:hypothetical protein CERSUDRAFT_77644 [Gelatoporia subvermispora B]